MSEYRGYRTRTGYLICLVPKMAFLSVLLLKAFGLIAWTWWTVGSVAASLILLWLMLDRQFREQLHEPPIFTALRKNDMATFESLLRQDPNLLAEKGPGASTLLHYAAYEGKAAVVQMLLDRGADPEAIDSIGATPVEIAAAQGKQDVVLTLRRHEETHGKAPLPASISAGTAAASDEYDVFLSYKSQDVHSARRIAEQLIGSGFDVWFAEYQILLSDRDQFEDAIDRGIQRSRLGLMFANEVYAESKHCAREVLQLLDRDECRVLIARFTDRVSDSDSCPDARLVAVDTLLASNSWDDLETTRFLDEMGDKERDIPPKVKLDVDSLLRCVDSGDRTSCESTNADEVSRLLERALGRRLEGLKVPGEQTYKVLTGKILGAKYALDLNGWRILSRGEKGQDGALQGAEFAVNTGQSTLRGNLHLGRDSNPYARERLAAPSEDDRKLYNDLMIYSGRHVSSLDADVTGVHLLFKGRYIDDHGRERELAQFGLTYFVNRYWTRKYSISLPHPKDGWPIEFVFTFGLRGSFRDFCLHAHLSEKVVRSLIWA